jgi:hypothetical protein
VSKADALTGRRPGARPSLATDKLVRKLLGLIRVGLTFESAAAAVGITSRTLRRWRKLGADPESALTYRELRAKVTEAVFMSEAALVENVSRQSRTDWRAGIALLERRFPERWAPPAVTLKGDKDAPLFDGPVTVRLVAPHVARDAAEAARKATETATADPSAP